MRAIAVLAVILYHINGAWLPGGYVGVDIFFVISGFFIIRIIMNEMAAGTFSLIGFWERRVRRIVPAMVVVLATVTAYSYFFLLLPIDLANYGKSLMAQSLFISNWWFMQQSSYFAAPVNSIPLLHTWSLSVEEQFYLLFPLLVLVVYPYIKKKIGPLMIGIAILSFAYGVFLVNMSPTASFVVPFSPHLTGSATDSSAGFYFIAARFWELLLGGLVAVYALTIRNRWLAELIALSGLVAIGSGMYFLNDATPFPGVAALLPALGTAAIIAANTTHHSRLHALLSFRPLVYVGLISYSLYLWHWPLLVLARYQLISPATLTPVHTMLLIIAIFALSSLTFHFIENPIRKKRFLAQRKHLFLSAICCVTALFAAGFVFAQTHGFPDRIVPQARLMAAAMNDLNPRMQDCFAKSENGNEPCLLGMQDPSHIDFVLWGDSHAGAAMPAFDEFGSETKQTGIFFAAPACPPFITDLPINNNQNCADEKQKAIAYIQKNIPDKLYIVSEWEEAYRYTDGSSGYSTLEPLLAGTLAQLPSQTKITVFLRTQTFPEQFFRSFFFQVESGQASAAQEPRPIFEASLQRFNTGVEQAVANFSNVQLLDPTTMFCDADYCRLADEQGFYYADDSHLSVYGALHIYLPLLLSEHQ